MLDDYIVQQTIQKTITEVTITKQCQERKISSKQIRNKCRMTPVLICVTIERCMTYMTNIPNCLQQKYLNMRSPSVVQPISVKLTYDLIRSGFCLNLNNKGKR